MLELGCLFCQGHRIWSGIALLIAQSNPGESWEYLTTQWDNILKTLCVMIASLTVFLLGNYIWNRKSESVIFVIQHGRGRLISRIVGGILVLSVVYSPISLYSIGVKDKDYRLRICKSVQIDTASTWIMYAYALNDVFNNHDYKALPQLADSIVSAEVTSDGDPDSLTIVYVIGESFSRCRSSLYGYTLLTNPMLAKEIADSSLILFDNVISMAQFTNFVYRNMLSTCDIQDVRPFESYPLLPALLRKAGYKVAYLDNQTSLSDEGGDVGCSYFFKNARVRENSVDMYNESTENYDGDFVDKYVSPFVDKGENNLIIYHLMGQHGAFSQRYPDSFRHFTADDYKHFSDLSEEGANTMADYDNATLYNDYVMSKIIDKIRDKIAILVYLSDHGEESYDYRDFSGRHLTVPITSIRLYNEVPAMVWMSNSFRQKYPKIVSSLLGNTHKAIYNSDLPHTILDIAGITTATLNPDVSLIRKGAGRTHRHVLVNDIDYDAMHDEIYRQKLRYDQ